MFTLRLNLWSSEFTLSGLRVRLCAVCSTKASPVMVPLEDLLKHQDLHPIPGENQCHRCAAQATTTAFDPAGIEHRVCANCATWSNSIDF